jgi:inner membrane protease subunit 2
MKRFYLSKLKHLLPVIRNAAIGFTAITLFTENVASWGNVSGRSMQPTFNNRFDETIQDVVIYHRFTSRLRRGDVVIARSPTDKSKYLIKRVVAMHGDKIRNTTNNQIVEIPKGYCWLEGDNSLQSRDSNWYGPIPISNIAGIVTHVVYPSFTRVSDKMPQHIEDRLLMKNWEQRPPQEENRI